MIIKIIKFELSGIPQKLKDAIVVKSKLTSGTKRFFVALTEILNNWDENAAFVDLKNLKRWWGEGSKDFDHMGISIDKLNKLCMYATEKDWKEFSADLKDSEKNLFRDLYKEKSKTSLHEIQVRIIDEYNNINWEGLLSEAKEITFCIFYCGEKFRVESSEIKASFINFFKGGGKLTLYLPNLLGIQNKFMKGTLDNDTMQKITKTRQTFNEWHEEAGKGGSLKIVSLDSGFNYMFAEILDKTDKSTFIFSPYQNHSEKNSSPVLLLNPQNMQNASIENFFKIEKGLIEVDVRKENRINLEEKRFITWDENNNRVFISLSLSCPGGCKFCYIDKIADKNFEGDVHQEIFAKLIAKTIVNDPRFKFGLEGTSIFFGGFTDPFKNMFHVRWTMEIIEIIGRFGNYFHIATRFLLRKRMEEWLNRINPEKFNVLINYSISQLDSEIEYTIYENGSQEDLRFVEARMLNEKGYTTALYIRPVLPVKTLKDTPQIIKLANGAGIKMVTIGGLYTDEGISTGLEEKDIKTKHLGFHENRYLILDNEQKLNKVKNISEVDRVRHLFHNESFECFNSSMEIINTLKLNNTNKIMYNKMTIF